MEALHELSQIPPITKCYLSLSILITLLVLYFNPELIFKRFQIWRLVTSFCFFGSLDFNFFFNMLFVYRYSRWLEENWYRRKASEFILLILFGAFFSMVAAMFIHLLFLSQVLIMMLVYVWSRRNPFVLLDFFGVLTVRAPYLPWIFFLFSFIIGNSGTVDILGIIIGHTYYYFDDIFPNQPNGFVVFKVPTCIKNMIDGNPEDDPYRPLPEVRPADRGDENQPAPQQQPGGYNWNNPE